MSLGKPMAFPHRNFTHQRYHDLNISLALLGEVHGVDALLDLTRRANRTWVGKIS